MIGARKLFVRRDASVSLSCRDSDTLVQDRTTRTQYKEKHKRRDLGWGVCVESAVHNTDNTRPKYNKDKVKPTAML